MFSSLDVLASCKREVPEGALTLPSMEALGQLYGLVLYSYSADDPGQRLIAGAVNFSSDTLHDRVQVFVDYVEVGSAYRAKCPASVRLPSGRRVDLLVENMGRI